MEQDIGSIVAVFAALGGSAYGVLQVRGRKRDQKDYKAIAEAQRIELNTEKTERIRLMVQVDGLEAQVRSSDTLMSEVRAKLTIISDDRENERLRYRTERDEVMVERGQIKTQMAELRVKTDALQVELKELRQQNDALKNVNNKLADYQLIAQEMQAKNRQLDTEIARLKDIIRMLENRNPDPPPADALEPTG